MYTAVIIYDSNIYCYGNNDSNMFIVVSRAA